MAESGKQGHKNDPTDDGTGIDYDSDDYLGDHVDQIIADDPLWSRLHRVVNDELLRSPYTTDDAFGRAIGSEVEAAIEHLNAAMRLQAARKAQGFVREESNSFVDRGAVEERKSRVEHRLAGAEPKQQPDDAGDIADTLGEKSHGADFEVTD